MMDIRSGIPALLFCKLAQVAKKTVPGEDLRPLHRRAPQEKKASLEVVVAKHPDRAGAVYVHWAVYTAGQFGRIFNSL